MIPPSLPNVVLQRDSSSSIEVSFFDEFPEDSNATSSSGFSLTTTTTSSNNNNMPGVMSSQPRSGLQGSSGAPPGAAVAYMTPYTMFLAILVAVLVFTRLVQICRVQWNQRRQRERQQGDTVVIDPLVFLDPDDRIRLYRSILERDGQCKKLEAGDFVAPDPSPGESETNPEDNDEESSPSIYLSFPSETDTEKQPSSQTDSSPQKCSGTCIVCFEDFAAGDAVVWSQNTSACSHVYHTDCLARFLASHSLRKKAEVFSYGDNPCPTCRQPFCTVSHEDVLMAVVCKSASVLGFASGSSNNNSEPPVAAESTEPTSMMTTP